jgi:hypothetical protein
MAFENLLENAAEKLVSNERLRSHLTDDEFTPCLDWALAKLTEAVAKAKDKEAAQKILAKELPAVEQVLKVINDSLQEGTKLSLKLPKKKIEVKDRAAFIHELLNLLKSKK